MSRASLLAHLPLYCSAECATPTNSSLFAILSSAEWTSCSACHELLCSRAFLFIVLRSAQHPQIPRFLQIFRGIWPMPLSLLNHSALALFAQRTRIPTSARSICFCAIWVCISLSLSRWPSHSGIVTLNESTDPTNWKLRIPRIALD